MIFKKQKLENNKMIKDFNIKEYTEYRKSENVSVEINDNEQDIKTFSEIPSKLSKNIFTDIDKIIYEETSEEKDEKIIKLTYLLSLQEMKQINLKRDKDNLLYINNKLKYENTLKELLLKKNLKDKEYANTKLKTYHLGYRVWKSLLGDPAEKLSLIE